jgi:hypothetical protein
VHENGNYLTHRTLDSLLLGKPPTSPYAELTRHAALSEILRSPAFDGSPQSLQAKEANIQPVKIFKFTVVISPTFLGIRHPKNTTPCKVERVL